MIAETLRRMARNYQRYAQIARSQGREAEARLHDKAEAMFLEEAEKLEGLREPPDEAVQS
jgi:hypothetical protein